MIDWCNNNLGFTSAALALTALLVSVCAIVISILLQRWVHNNSMRLQTEIHTNSMRLQTEIHNRDVKLALNKKILEIYNAFSDCYRLLNNTDNILLYAKCGFTSKIQELIIKVVEHRVTTRRLLDEASLLMNDEPLEKLLFEMWGDFNLLSKNCISLVGKSKLRSKETLLTIVKEFPDLNLMELCDANEVVSTIMSHPQAFERFNELHTTLESKKFDDDLKTYCEKFTYEKFDKLFHKHLICTKL